MRFSIRAIVKELGPFLAAAGLWLFPLALHPDSIAFWRGGAYSDLLISHWPNALWLHQSLVRSQRIPLWNPTILSGMPFVADPLSGVWYLPNWLAALWPTAVSFNLLFWLHLAWAGWGAARLARAEGARGIGPLISGLAFGGAPKLIGHVGLGHLSLVSAVSWTPWLLIAAGRAVEGVSEGDPKWFRRAALAGALIAIVFIADPRWTIPAGLAALAYGAWRLSRSHPERLKSPPRTRLLVAAGASGLFGIGIAAGLGLPLIELVSLSTRTALTQSDRTALSIPVDRLVRFGLPDYGGWPEQLAYPGIAVLLLAAIALVVRPRRSLFWSCLAAAAGLLSAGPVLLIYTFMDRLIPGLSLLRVPGRFIYLTLLSLAVMAGIGIDVLSSTQESSRRQRGILGAGLGLIGYVVLAALADTAGFETINPAWRAAALAGGMFALVSVCWLGLVLRGSVGPTAGGIGWVLLVCADLALMSLSRLRIVQTDVILRDRSDLMAQVAEESGGARVFSPSNSLRQPAAVYAGIELADGVNPLQLASYRDYMGKATGFSTSSYSVTLPPFPDGDPSAPWPVSLDARRLGQLNIRFVVSEYPIQANGLTLDGLVSGAYVYHNMLTRPRAWVQPASDVEDDWRPVDRIEWSPEAISIEAAGPGTLVLSEVVYPGWQARHDGRPVPIQALYGVLRAVDLPSGIHEVEFVYRPTIVYVGAAISLLTLVTLIGLWSRR